MKDLNLIVATISLLILLFGFVKKRMEKSFISEPLLALLLGIFIGPEVTGWVQWEAWEKPFELLHQITRFTISVALMATALRLSRHFLKTYMRSYLSLLFGAMLLMGVFASLLFLVTGFGFWESLLIGAIITPTDPVLATTIVSGTFAENVVPDTMRHSLSFESASNDGLAYPMVLLPLTFVFHEQPLSHWFFKILLWENVGAIILGAGIGYGFSQLFRFFRKKDWLELRTLLATSLTLTFLLTTSLSMIEMNGIIGVFAGGLTFSWVVDKDVGVREEKIQSMMELLFIVPVFVLLGIMIPWDKWAELSWIVWIIAPLSIILRRMPAIFILRPLIRIFDFKDSLFAGWFGPVGVAAIFYVTYVHIEYPGMEYLWPIVSLVVCSSTLIHAITAYPFTRSIYEHKNNPS